MFIYNGETNTLPKAIINCYQSSADKATKIRANLIVPSEGYWSLLEGNMWDIELAGEEVEVVISLQCK